MTRTPALRALRALTLPWVWAAVASGPAQAAPLDTVPGLIVQLRGAPTHGALMRESAHAVHEGERWQRVLGTAPDMRLRERRAVMASAQQLRFEQPLSREQAEALAARLAAQPEVAWAVPDTRERRLANPPNDPYLGQQWWVQGVGGVDSAPIANRLRGVAGFLSAWTVRDVTGTAGARVAVLDSGVVKSHPDLAGRLAAGYDMVSDSAYANDGDGRDADPSDPGDWVDASDLSRDPGHFNSCAIELSAWHGTAVAGIVGALTNNSAGMAGIDWGGTVVPVRVAGKCGATVSDIVDGMRWAAGVTDVCKTSDGAGNCTSFVPRNTSPVRVINISFGGSGACTPYQAAIDELKALGVVVVAAAGNEHTAPTRPAKCPGVVGVVATNRDGFKSNYSNFGAALTASGIATVGGDDADPDARWNSLADSGILSIGNSGDTVPEVNSYFNYWGTSFAAPQVAGAISLMLSVRPTLTYDEIIQGLKRSARPHVTSTLSGVNACSDANPGRCLCTTATCGAGLLDVEQAVLYAANPSTYTPPSAGAAIVNADELRIAAAQGADRPSNTTVVPPASGGGGGGSMSPLWLAALALASAALARRRRG